MIGKLIRITDGDKHCLSHAYDNAIGIVIPYIGRDWMGEIRIARDVRGHSAMLFKRDGIEWI